MTRTDGLGSQQPVKAQEFNDCSGGILQQTSLAIVRRQLKTELVVREHPTGLGLPNREPCKIEEFILEQERFTNTRRRNAGCRMAQPTCSPTEIEE